MLLKLLNAVDCKRPFFVMENYMPDGRPTEVIGIVEKAARKLAASYGTGSYLKCIRDLMNTANVKSRNENLGIAWRGTREESAARRINSSTNANALHRWTLAGGVVSLPRFYPDKHAIAAMFKVEKVPAALMRVYALEHWHDWPTVEHAALIVIDGKGAREAVCDAMARILWRKAVVPKDDRAKQLGMRAQSYRALTGKAELLLWRWLDRAGAQLLKAMRTD